MGRKKGTKGNWRLKPSYILLRIKWKASVVQKKKDQRWNIRSRIKHDDRVIDYDWEKQTKGDNIIIDEGWTWSYVEGKNYMHLKLKLAKKQRECVCKH